MKKVSKVISMFLIVTILFGTFSLPVNAGVPASTVRFSVVDMKVTSSPIEEENYFTVQATYHASVTNHGWDSQVWHQCSCGGSGVVPRYGGDKGKTRKIKLTCGQSYQGRVWKCRENCDGYDYQDQEGDWGEVTHNTKNPWDGNHTNSWDDGKTHIWNKKNPIPCECHMIIEISDTSSNDGMVTCRSCGGTGSIYNGLVSCGHCDESNRKSCKHCNGTGQVKSFSTCKECNGRGQVTQFITCDKCGGSGGHYVSVHHDPSEPPGSVSTMVDIALDGHKQDSKEIKFNLSTTSKSSSAWTKEGTVTVEWTVYTEEGIGKKTVETTIDGGNEPQERKSITVEVLPACNLVVDFVEPNAFYRNGTEVISTFVIKNHNSDLGLNIRPKHQLTAKLTVKNKNTGQVIATVSKKDIVIPKGKSNIVYFKWLVPKNFNFGGADTGEVILQCDINTGYIKNNYGVNEKNHKDNSITAKHLVKKYDVMETPDTKFEKKAPSWFRVPSVIDRVQTDKFATSVYDTSSFSEWVYEKDNYILKEYNLTLKAENKLEPDINSPSHKLINNVYNMKSGYGISTKTVANIISGNAPSSSFTKPQNATMHIPEYRYKANKNEYRTLELTSGSTFEFEKNKYATNSDGKSDNRRIHFTPLYYPDGEYNMKVYVFDSWTPMGMLSIINDDKVVIKGNMYDDWYLSHGKKN